MTECRRTSLVLLAYWVRRTLVLGHTESFCDIWSFMVLWVLERSKTHRTHILHLQHICLFSRPPLQQIRAARQNTGEARQTYVSRTPAATQHFCSGGLLGISARCLQFSAKIKWQMKHLSSAFLVFKPLTALLQHKPASTHTFTH